MTTCPHVTEVIRSVYPGYPVDQWYLDRGTAVHEAVRLALQNRLDWATVDPRIEGRVRAALKFVADTKMVVLGVEVNVTSMVYRYTGRLDLLGDIDDTRTLVDWKGGPVETTDMQMAAYADAYNDDHPKAEEVKQAIAIITHDDGTYTSQVYRDLRTPHREYLAALTLYRRKQRKGG